MTYFTALMTVMRKSRNVFATASAPRLRPSPLPWHPDQFFREHAEAIGRRDGSMTGGNRGGRGGRGGQGAATFLSPTTICAGGAHALAMRLEVQSQGVAFAAERRTAALPRVGAPPALSADGDRNVAAPCRPPAASGPEFNHARLLPSLDLILT